MMRPRCRPVVVLAAAVLVSLCARPVYAEPSWCKPRNGIAAAIAGDVFGKVLGAGLGGRVLGQAGESGWSVFGPAPTPSDFMRECIAPRLGGQPEPEERGSDPIVSSPGPWVLGDPHLLTRDGLRYAFQGAGDYVLLATDGLEIQGRFFRRSRGSSASQPLALALQVGDTRIVLGNETDPVQRAVGAQINSMPFPFDDGSWYDLPGGGYVHRVGRLWRVEIPGMLSIAMDSDGSPMEFQFDSALPGGTVGLFGNADGDPSNDLALADGTPIDPRDTDTLNGAFLDSWLREGSASLFEGPYDPEKLGEVRPVEVTALSDFSAADRAAATKQCLDAGVLADGPLAECAYDMLTLDDESLLDDHVEASLGFAGSLSPELVYAPTGSVGTPLALGDQVSPGVPTGGAGELTAPGEVDRFSINLTPGTTAFVEVTSPCSATEPTRLALGGGSGPTVERALVCGASIQVPDGVTWLAVYSAAGEARPYAFDFLAETRGDIGTIPYDTALSGQLQGYGPLVGQIEAQPGDPMSLQPDDDMPCTRDWAIVDGAGTPIASVPQCVRLHAVVLTGSAPWRLQLESGPRDARWGFELTRATDPGPDPTGTPPQTVSAEIPSNGDPVTVTLELDGTTRLYFEGVDGPAGRWSLLDPAGTEVQTWQSGLDAFISDVPAGSWTLRFSPQEPGGVARVLLHQVPADTVIDGSVGDTVRLSVSAPGQLASVRFSLTAGQRVYVDRDSVLLGRLVLLAPDGSTAATTALSQQDLLHQAAETGVYVLAIDAFDAKTGDLDVTLYDVADDIQVDASVGTPVTLSTTTPGQRATATLDLTVNQTITLAVTERSGAIRLDLFDSTGTRALSYLGSSRTFTATVSGPHTLVLTGNDEGTGSATLTVE